MSNKEYPIIWIVKDKQGNRVAEVIKLTYEEALEAAKRLYGRKAHEVISSGKKKPPSKCCNDCGDKPCS